MHEFELGVWKSVFVHLIRILESVGPDAVAELNARYRVLGTFGTDTIRKFHHDVSEMKKLAARDLKDILQCSAPCFAGLFPNHDQDIQVLLCVLAEWHFLAKLRMHSETTISALRVTTKVLGSTLRHFRDHVAKSYTTYETNKEYRARHRRMANAATSTEGMQATTPIPNLSNSEPTTVLVPKSTQRCLKSFNLQTYKIHALGDVPESIRLFGTTDSYSTQVIELEHRRAKRQYKRTNHIEAVKQMTQLERREAHLRTRAAALVALKEGMNADKAPQPSRATDAYHMEVENPIQWGSPSDKYHIAARGKPDQLGAFISRHGGDPALKVDFYTKLDQHLAARLGVSPSSNIDASKSPGFSQHIPQTTIPSFKIYEHAAIRVNFTTYDVHRAHDTINPKTSHRFVMLRNVDDDVRHPFWYAKVLGIYHVDARVAGGGVWQPTRRFNFLWVRWLGESKWGNWKQHRLDRVSYVDSGSTDGSFDFIDPALVIRAVYLVPAFHLGRTKNFLRQSIAWDFPEEGDWVAYYVIRFVDRDMGMRYLGGGIGHCDPIPTSDDPGPLAGGIEADDAPALSMGDCESTLQTLEEQDRGESEDEVDDASDSESEPEDELEEEGIFDV
ncbi:hypothetical protein FRC10_009567 [Ceratobasidium sp. 414]|nr:hypothetical protein FRC10_009567 [Ceratobasidium sp. 414]